MGHLKKKSFPWSNAKVFRKACFVSGKSAFQASFWENIQKKRLKLIFLCCFELLLGRQLKRVFLLKLSPSGHLILFRIKCRQKEASSPLWGNF